MKHLWCLDEINCLINSQECAWRHLLCLDEINWTINSQVSAWGHPLCLDEMNWTINSQVCAEGHPFCLDEINCTINSQVCAWGISCFDEINCTFGPKTLESWTETLPGSLRAWIWPNVWPLQTQSGVVLAFTVQHLGLCTCISIEACAQKPCACVPS